MPHDERSGAERRAEPRHTAAGQVRLRQSSPLAEPFTGQLMDVARTGFRAHHDRLSLGSGQLVEFQMARRHGRARAVWTRILDGKAETGFRIVAQGKD